ncbi:VOC family protein [Anaerovorax odorimutans]|uniref:VOC family protein n=1 Tax=Anaerovorax odorimutans TaxID=109327 RepID=A0ABT1RQ65_9FIRM|nr:VOC family protein [Anaerovorax odorimutans]MCQ4637333.1 VOC family protein [Anaerovorax odorimutans]
MSTRIQYTTMIVNNMEKTLEFYRKAFGFEIDSEFNPQPETRIVIIKDKEGRMLELIQNAKFETGLYSIGMDVDDLEETARDLESKGYEITGPMVPTLVGRMTFTKDPNGVNIALIEHNMEYALKQE